MHNKMNSMDGVTAEEVSKLTKAMKDDQFRGYMDEYCRETSDPAHRKEYLQYLEQLEAKGEMPEGQALLRCQPGLCVKTTILFKSGQQQKCFINVVHTDQLDDLKMGDAEKAGGGGRNVQLPYSLSPPRPDRDLKDQYCMTCDLAVSTRTFLQAKQSPQILKLVVDTAADGLASKFLQGYEEVKKDFKVMQRMQCKGGMPMPMSIQASQLKTNGKVQARPKLKPGSDAVTPGELRKMRAEAKEKRKLSEPQEVDDEKEEAAPAPVEEVSRRIRVPKHSLIHSGVIDLTDFMESNHRPSGPSSTIPQLLKLTVELPTVKKSSDINLEVTSLNVVVEVAEKFYLDLPLPYEVQENDGTARFDKGKQALCLELPVKAKPQNPNPAAAESVSELESSGVNGDLREGLSSDDELPPLEAEVTDEVEEPPPEPPEPPPEQPPLQSESELPPVRRERLEVDPRASGLVIARVADEQEVTESDSHPRVEDNTEEEDLPMFEAAETFAGARDGYFFSLGEQGLGYYRDLHQSRPASREAAPSARTGDSTKSSAWVIDATPEENAARPALSAELQRYVDETSALTSPVDCPAEEGPEEEELEHIWHQTRHNVTLFADIPDNREVAAVRVHLAGQRLLISFCSRASSGASDGSRRSWRRHRLRVMLFGLIDPKQWHTELTEGSPRQLAVVLRKADGVELWPGIATPVAAATASPWEDDLGDSGAAYGVDSGDSAGSAAEPSERQALESSRADVADRGSPGLDVGFREAAVAEDSAQLDTATPTVQGSAAGKGSAEAEAAAVQSATVMGQAVLLRSRLMYQLL